MGIGGKVKNSILSGKWIWPFPFDPFLGLRGTRPAHSAPAFATLASSCPARPASSPRPCLHCPLSVPLHLIRGISWTYACLITCWQISSFKDSKRGHQDVSFKSDKENKTYPPHALSICVSGCSWAGGNRAALKRGMEPPPRADSFP